MANPYGRAGLAGNLGEALWGPHPVNNLPTPRVVFTGGDAVRMAATVGLVSPLGRIVLWDEWTAAHNPRHVQKVPAPGQNRRRVPARAADPQRR